VKNVFLAIILFGGSFVVLLFISQNVGVTSPLFPVQRLDESLIFLTKRSPEAKAEYYQYLIQKRFSDISYCIKTNHTNILLSGSLRYSTTVGKAVQFVMAANSKKYQLKLELELQKKTFHDIILQYRSKDEGRKYIEDDINYINIYEKDL